MPVGAGLVPAPIQRTVRLGKGRDKPVPYELREKSEDAFQVCDMTHG